MGLPIERIPPLGRIERVDITDEAAAWIRASAYLFTLALSCFGRPDGHECPEERSEVASRTGTP